jgi:hypothetical protein
VGTLAGMPDETPESDVPSKPPMQLRRVRIAVSAFFGVLSVALCVLWVRSYSRCDIVTRTTILPFLGNTSANLSALSTGSKRIIIRQSDARTTTIGSNSGYCYFIRLTSPSQGVGAFTQSISHGWKLGGRESYDGPARFQWFSNANHSRLKVPYWFLTALTASLAASVIIRTRFSLRTLLLVMTLVAGALGVAVWQTR